jgi:hypothetical protein
MAISTDGAEQNSHTNFRSQSPILALAKTMKKDFKGA